MDNPDHRELIWQVVHRIPCGAVTTYGQGRLPFAPDSRPYQRQQSLLEAKGVIFIRARCSHSRFRWGQENETLPRDT